MSKHHLQTSYEVAHEAEWLKQYLHRAEVNNVTHFYSVLGFGSEKETFSVGYVDINGNYYTGTTVRREGKNSATWQTFVDRV